MTTRIIAAVLALAALASCSKDDGNITDGGIQDDSRTAIVPSASLNASAASGSRAALPEGPVAGTTFPASTEKLFAVTAYKGTTAPSSDYSTAYFDNEAVDSDAEGRLSFETMQYYPADGEKLYFYAYSPVRAAASDGDGYTAGTASGAPTVKYTITGQQDILWAKADDGTGKVSAGTVQPQPEFGFEHLLKRVRFKLVRGEGFGDGIHATRISITGCRTQASLDPISGTLTFSGEGSPLSLAGNYAIQSAEQAAEISESLMCEPGPALSLEVEAQGITYRTSVTLTSSDSGITAGGAGVSHLVTLTFIGTQIVPEASIEPWIDAGETEGTIK